LNFTPETGRRDVRAGLEAATKKKKKREHPNENTHLDRKDQPKKIENCFDSLF
jgi:hypothetical protein